MSTFHKRIFLVIIVVAPMWWLLFTEDGKRRSDTLVLWLMGGDPIDINFSVLDNKYSVDDWKKVFSDISWQCREQRSEFGDYLCFSEISSYNGIPARYLSVFFKNSYVHAIKLVYRNQYHQQIALDLQQQLGTPVNQLGSTAEGDVLKWDAGYGMLFIKKSLTSNEDASMMWVTK